MTTFYRDSGVYIGSAEFQVEDQAYRLEDLELVWHRRGPRGAPGMAIIAGRVALILAVLAIIAGVAAALRGMDLSLYDDTTVLIGVVVGVVLAGAIGLFVVEGVITLIERS